ncbi:alpha/beta hydrolase family protein [Rhodococcus spongiicola]|uniref:Alpha/beta hydrolase n=1 Tax=Rhodococcus spongiicola TaxID=2487352 RepID=A0A438APW3_9NOCA|nr:hypothetical protein [Rhodococcus spongiicola]RVW00923.1 hypothetical protein EF834_16255 [Rhodococcus spongiicola]
MAVKVVFLHGIGDGDPQAGWLEGLNRGLTQAGHDPIARAETLAPRYSAILSTDGIGAKMPQATYRAKDDAKARFAFARRQARIQRSLGLAAAPSGMGMHLMPEGPLNAAQGFAVGHVSAYDLPQVRRYVRNDPLRGAVLRYLLDHDFGNEIVLIGHSLGSVIAIDLLHHLPENVHVRRFVTIGSPAAAPSLHEGSERLLKKFPYARVDDWSNIFNPGDLVTGGRGLASIFPAAQDFAVDLGMLEHGASTYLGHPAAASLVADIVYPSKSPVLARSGIAVRLTDTQASVLLLLHYGHAVARHIKDQEAAARYTGALRVRQDQVVAEIEELATVGQQPLAAELHQLVDGDLPAVPQRWELHEAVSELAVLALTNAVDPYEIDVERAPMQALPETAVALGFSPDVGDKVARAIEEVQKVLNRRGGAPWGRVLTAAAGVALLAAGPVGLLAAAPATAAGAAAITGGLAAFGPGGMVGGLAMLGGLAGTGAAITATAVASGGGEERPVLDLKALVLRVTIEHARKMLDLPFDRNLWYQLADAETQVCAQINRLEAFSGPKSTSLTTLREIKDSLGRLMRFVIEKELAPVAIAGGDGSERTGTS